jgi:hypothetical protein
MRKSSAGIRKSNSSLRLYIVPITDVITVNKIGIHNRIKSTRLITILQVKVLNFFYKIFALKLYLLIFTSSKSKNLITKIKTPYLLSLIVIRSRYVWTGITSLYLFDLFPLFPSFKYYFYWKSKPVFFVFNLVCTHLF